MRHDASLCKWCSELEAMRGGRRHNTRCHTYSTCTLATHTHCASCAACDSVCITIHRVHVWTVHNTLSSGGAPKQPQGCTQVWIDRWNEPRQMASYYSYDI